MSWQIFRSDSEYCGSPTAMQLLGAHDGRTGITCVLGENYVKRISSVAGPAGGSDVHVCDEIVSIEGEQVNVENVSGFDCVEMCRTAIRERHRVEFAIKDFCTQEHKSIVIEVGGASSPLRSIYSGDKMSSLLPRVHSNPDFFSNGAPVTPTVPPAPQSWGLGNSISTPKSTVPPTLLTSWSLGGSTSNVTSRCCSTPSDSQESSKRAVVSNQFLDDRVYNQTPKLHNRSSFDDGDGCKSGSRGGWKWVLPSRRMRFIFIAVGILLGILAWLSWVLRDEASVDQIVSFFDVLRYNDYTSDYGVGSAERSQLCDKRPSWMMGSCVKSTDTIKYLGRFDTLDECEEACLGYMVGSTRCRSFTYHFAAFRDPRFRHSCWGVTHAKWQKTRAYAVTSGRVFGPLVRLQRMILWIVRKASTRVLTGWWQDGKPWEVAMAVVCVLFGLSGVRRAPSQITTPTELHLN